MLLSVNEWRHVQNSPSEIEFLREGIYLFYTITITIILHFLFKFERWYISIYCQHDQAPLV